MQAHSDLEIDSAIYTVREKYLLDAHRSLASGVIASMLLDVVMIISTKRIKRRNVLLTKV
jgi:hypothetical protein